VAEKGRQRYLKNGWTNMKVAERILRAVFELEDPFLSGNLPEGPDLTSRK
jgi:hypothetical protein